MRRKLMILLALVAALSLFLVACGGNDADATEADATDATVTEADATEGDAGEEDTDVAGG